ncbi:SulP family inorganic anion transporter [Streptomyces sp. NEAU-174]|uniref:SulP family inorganic anion transporter n=1 Tax=Streptomyces sp. NEAU-174 TaxID=3458254 RepID=UPI0040442623
MPGLGALAGYRRSWLRGDLLAGVTVAAYLVPQVMAYAGVAGLPTSRRAVGDPARPRVVCVVRVLPTAVGSARVDDPLMTATVVGPLAGGDAGHYASLAAALAVTVGLVLTARAFTGRSDDEPGLDANQEFLALGAANLGAGALHGFPVSSSASRTALAASTGARSQGYSLVAGAMVLAVLLFLSPLLSRTPSAVLGALVVYADWPPSVAANSCSRSAAWPACSLWTSCTG